MWTIAVVVGVGAALFLLGVLLQVVLWLLLTSFLSFALEPAVNRLARRGWRRGTATGLLLAATFFLLVGVGLNFVVAIVRGAAGLAERIGGIFAMFTVGMFIFYMVAEGPRFKRAVLSSFPRQRQEELVSIWEAAIDKTGGYFYPKLLLTLINGGLFFVVLVALGVPGAAALATFQGVVAEFIPIVGTYIAAIVPLLVALFSVGSPETLILLIYVLIYQQVENYLLAPRLQARTMQLHPAVAFGAALAAGAIGGLLWAFLAIPFAATIQASASLWIEHHEVLEVELTAEAGVGKVVKEEKERRSLGHRVGGLLRSSRGWIRRGARETSEVLEEPDTDTGEVVEVAGPTTAGPDTPVG